VPYFGGIAGCILGTDVTNSTSRYYPDRLIGLLHVDDRKLRNKDDEDIDDNKRYPIEEAFPDFCPATVLHGARLRRDLTQTVLQRLPPTLRDNRGEQCGSGKSRKAWY
jgi:hypothetical protein